MTKQNKPYAVFLSYNSEDAEAVEQIAVYLKEQADLLPWLDRWNLIPGKSVLAHIESGLTTSAACAVFVGKSGQGPWQNKEVEGVLRQQIQNADVAVIPVLLPDAPEKPELPLFLQGNLWVDFRGKGLDDVDALWLLECGIRGEPPGSGRPLCSQNKHNIMNTIEFVNRLNEISFITNVHCPPYLLISAPMGYGKTWLLEAIQRELEKQHWLCVNVRLSQETSYTIKSLTLTLFRQILPGQIEPDDLSCEKAGETVGRHLLQQQKHVTLLIDEVERLDQNVVKEIINRCLLTIRDVLGRSGKTLRMIFAGRYIAHWKKIPGVKIPLELIHQKQLTPFDFEAVQQTVNLFDSRYNFHTIEEYRRDFASHLMYSTGGHPKCMAQILSDDFGASIEDKEEVYYQRVVQPVIAEIYAHIPAELRSIFDAVSVMRRFNARFLQQLLAKGLIQWSQGDAYNLEDRLRKTFLINKKEGFLQDDMIRRLLAIHLRRTNPEHYVNVCAEAVAFYEAGLQETEALKPELLAIEWLFQKLQWMYHKQQANKAKFFAVLPEMLDMLRNRRYAADIIESIVERLQDINEEWEFRFLCNYLLREGVYENEYPFKELILQLTAFQQGLQGGKDHARTSAVYQS